MSTWSGWQADLLTHAAIPNTAANRRFLSDWHSHAETNCRNNPVDLSVTSAGATNCHALPGLIARAQNYSTTGNAVHAFNVQIHQNAYGELLDALLTGNPYTAPNTGLASQALAAWGSQSFAQAFFNETANAPGRGGGIAATDAFKGWNDLRVSLNKHWPSALNHSARQGHRALRLLGRARRVKL